MPTGYTSIINEKPDVTFREYALRCARGMDACIMQRDDPMGDPPKVPEPSDFYMVRLRETETRLHELETMSPESARALWQAEVEQITKQNAEETEKCLAIKHRYARIRDEVVAWVSPTPDHEGLRRFMLDQLQVCRSEWTPYLRPTEATPADWLAANIEAARWDITCAREGVEREMRRHEERKAWIEALYASLDGAP